MASSCACVDFLRLSLSSHERRRQYLDHFAVERVCSLDERQKIRESAHDCHLCQKIHDILRDIYRDQYYLPSRVDGPFVAMRIGYSQLHGDEKLVSCIELSNDDETGEARGFYPRETMSFAAWADQETPASTPFVDWQPIFEGDSNEIAGFVGKLLDNCLSHHAGCRLQEPTWEFDLPSRVLCIGNDFGDISVKLVQGRGLSGRYCALSHCWGSENKRPLQTTNTNITDHLSSIPWNNLPPLFKDAVTLTRDLGIQYLWIDSLCILQDDKQDWHNESKRMSLIYRRATIVIAAVDSEDSTQRLSKAKRPAALTLSVPYNAQGESAQGRCNLVEAELEFIGKPMEGPLRERAWAFQELYLGRRIIFFTSAGLHWKCGECELNERANWRDLCLYETVSWLDCLEEYSGKHLTYTSDRIIALLGIVAEMAESRKDSFMAEFGIWEGHLTEQLLWRSLEIRNEDLDGLPTWCWAATGGAKSWITNMDLEQAILNGSLQSVKLKESGSIRASGVLIGTTVSSTPVQQCCIQQFGDTGRGSSGLEDLMLPSWTEEFYEIKRYVLLDQNGADDPLGLSVFDTLDYSSECFCFVLASSRRSSGDQCSPDYEKRPFNDEDKSDDNAEDGCQTHVHRETPECVDIVELGHSTEAYWALLLQPVHGASKRFKRVGMALLWPRALEAAQSEVTEFEIV